MNYEKIYKRIHVENIKMFSGNMDIENADEIARLVAITGARRLIDYGSGKGYQYLKQRVHDRWGGIVPYCYDIGVPQLSEYPTGVFDGLICTDVLEHIEEIDLDDAINDAFSLLDASKVTFAYFNIFCNPAGKLFSDGTNMHVTVKHPNWWDDRLYSMAPCNVKVVIDYEYDSNNYV